MVDCILTLPVDEAYTIQGELLPITSYHVNTNLVVKALVTAVENIIDLQLSQSPSLESQLEDSMAGDGSDSWSHRIKVLMKCLVSLDTTVAGSHTARKALQELMSEHGDILSECWSASSRSESRSGQL
jgi:hypothetical protein